MPGPSCPGIFSRGRNLTKITTDFETRSDANLKKVGAYEYSAHDSTLATCLGFKSDKSKTCHLLKFHQMQKHWDEQPEGFKAVWFDWIADPDVVFSAHNAFFEQCIYENVLVRRLGWPRIPTSKWRCTAAKAAAVAIPRNLADAGAVMRTATQKDYEGHRVMLKLCKPTAAWVKWAKKKPTGEPEKYHTAENSPEDYAKLYHYCKIDVISEELLDASLPDLTPFEQQLWFIDQAMNLRGIQVDMPLVNKISQIMASESKTMNKELDVLTMGLVSSGNARAAILDFLTLEGIKLPDLRAKTVDDFIKNGKATGDAEAVLKIRRSLSKSSTAKYQTFKMRGASDGRVRDLLLYHAASTGRWGGKGIQPQNFPRGIIKDIFEAIARIHSCSVDDLKMLYGENLMPLFSSVLRGMFIATPGYELFVEDYNAIECRVTWWLAGHEKGLQLFREGSDPYREMAAKIYGISVLEVTEEQRQVGKAAVLGCGYQMGGKKFVSSAWDVYRAKVDLTMAKVAVTAYREMHYPVTEMWEQYKNACIFAVENPSKRYRVGRVRFFVEGRFLKIMLPSGRPISYCDPKVIWTEVEIKDDDGNVVNRFKAKQLVYMAVNQKAKKEDCIIPKWTLERTYGGKIVENVVQAVSRDILAEAIVRATEKGFDVLMHSHDELVCEAPKGDFTSEDYRAVVEVLPTWAGGLPLKSGGWAGDRYKKG
jgi:DNA polymerase